MEDRSQTLKGRIDWVTTAVPFLLILLLCLCFFLFPDASKNMLDSIRFFLGDQLGVYYLAIGLGVFTVVGMDTAMKAGYEDYRFLTVFLGVITGVGGGILRDIMAVQAPYVLKKHIYACASLAGALCYMWLLPRMDRDAAVVISACLVVAIRILARHYKWNLPRIEKGDGEEEK